MFSSPYTSLEPLLCKPTSFTPPPFEPGPEALEILQEKRVLVVGAGGLGCEILKNLALSGFTDISILDLDTIELSNLNRQFLFREEDIGRFKSQVAAEFVQSRCPHVQVTAHTNRLEAFSKEFYADFDLVIAGLDSVPARRWLNSMLVSLVQVDEQGKVTDFDSVIPFIDGGTEGWKGQTRLFLPRISSCYECSLASLPRQKEFASCTIANVPRLPEHCIAYASKKLWPQLLFLGRDGSYKMSDNGAEENGVELDTDDMTHMQWIFERAQERAASFGISGVTFSLTMQVVKNIIPAIAATNALISAACVNEAFKAMTWCSQSLNNYFMYLGHTGIYSRTFEYERNPDCIVCGAKVVEVSIDESAPLEHLLNMLVDRPDLKLKSPSMTLGDKVIFMGSGALAQSHQVKLEQPVSDFFTVYDSICVTDKKVLGEVVINVKLKFVPGEFWIPPSDD